MGEVGGKFKANEMYMSEVLIAARAMYVAMDVIRPLLSESGALTKSTVYALLWLWGWYDKNV